MLRRPTNPLLLMAAVSILSQLACKSDSPTTPDSPNYTVTAITPVQLSGIVGSVSQTVPTVQVLSARTQRPAAGVEVRFVGESVLKPVVLTDANGIASAGEWRFSNRPGIETVAVLVGDRQEVVFTARVSHDVPVNIYGFGVFDDALVALAGHRVPSFRFAVVDRFGNPVSDVNVSFSVSSGRLDSQNAWTDRGGYGVIGSWLLDEKPGAAQLTFSAGGVRIKEFGGYGIDSSSIRWYTLRETRGITDVPDLRDSRITQSRFGLTDVAEQKGFFIDQDHTLFGDTSEQGGRFTRTNSTLTLGGLYGNAYLRGDTVLVEKFDSLDLDTFDPVFVTRVYVAERNQ